MKQLKQRLVIGVVFYVIWIIAGIAYDITCLDAQGHQRFRMVFFVGSAAFIIRLWRLWRKLAAAKEQEEKRPGTQV